MKLFKPQYPKCVLLLCAKVVVPCVSGYEHAGQDYGYDDDIFIMYFFPPCVDNVKYDFHVRSPNTDRQMPRIV